VRLPRKFLLPATMVVLFFATCLLHRWDQRAWEKDNHTALVEWHEDPNIADHYEGYIEPGWLGGVYALQLPGLIPVAAFSEPMPVYIHVTWWIYCADLLSICATWFAVGVWLDRRYKKLPPRFTSLFLNAAGAPSVMPHA